MLKNLFKNKLFLFGLILAALVVILSVLLLYAKVYFTPKSQVTTTPDAYADWKTYRNENYKLQLKYPSNISIEERSRGFIRIWFDKERNWIDIYILSKNEPSIGPGIVGSEIKTETIIINNKEETKKIYVDKDIDLFQIIIRLLNISPDQDILVSGFFDKQTYSNKEEIFDDILKSLSVL